MIVSLFLGLIMSKHIQTLLKFEVNDFYVNDLFHEKFAILHMQKQELISCAVTYAAISALFFAR